VLPRSGPNDIFVSFFSKYSFIINAETFIIRVFFIYTPVPLKDLLGVYNRHL
jgi:hypothetical protein